MSERTRGGFRGYIVSRPVRGTSYPQRVQNLVVRDYAQRMGLTFKLSVTEYAMPDCTMMLEQLLGELPSLAGIVVFSAFVLPPERRRRAALVARILAGGAELHAALENIAVRSAADGDSLEEMLDVAALLASTPFGGRYEKGAGAALSLDPNGRALLATL